MPEALRTVDALVHAARSLPDARSDRLALFGHSRGGGAALSYIVRVGAVQAAVLNSARYPRELVAPSSRLDVPVLMLHGTEDSPADGGSETTHVQMARDFEAALRAAGKPVEAMYYEGARHNDIFNSSSQYRDELQRMSVFLLRHLRD